MLLVVIFKAIHLRVVVVVAATFATAAKHQCWQKCCYYLQIYTYFIFASLCCYYWWAALYAPCPPLYLSLYHWAHFPISHIPVYNMIFMAAIRCCCLHLLPMSTGCLQLCLGDLVSILLLFTRFCCFYRVFEFSISAVKVFNAMRNVNIPSVPLEFIPPRNVCSKRLKCQAKVI